MLKVFICKNLNELLDFTLRTHFINIQKRQLIHKKN